MRLYERLTASAGVSFEGELIESRQTPFQLIEIFQTDDLGKLMRIDGANMTSERDEFLYHEALVHPAAICHASPRNVLIIGGGDGGAAEEILKHPSVARVVLAEIDGGVIEMAKKHLRLVHRDVFANPKLDVRVTDGAAFVRAAAAQFDLLYLDLTDPQGVAEALYTAHFYRDCKRVLNEGGALVLHLGAPFFHAPRVVATLLNLRATFSVVTAYFVHIPSYGATWGFAVASGILDPRKAGAGQVDALLAARQIADRQFYCGDTHTAMLALPPHLKTMIG